MGKVIEFFGKTGCGKSTTVDHCMLNPNFILQRKDFKLSEQEKKLIESFIKEPLFHNYLRLISQVSL